MLRLDGLTISVGGKRVCERLSLRIGEGECWVVLGVNGVGKTTLLHTLAGLRIAQSGTVALTKVGAGGTAISATNLAEIPPRQRAQRIALMSQDDDFAAETTVLDAVLLGRLPHLSWWQGERLEDVALARAALRQVGLDASFEPRLASTLSGGERRRVALAALLAQQAPLLILDEPNTHLDLHQQIALLDLLAALPTHTLIMSLHDVNLAARYGTHALLLFGDGACCGGPLTEMINAETLSRLYRHRIEALPAPAGQRGPLYFPA